MALFTASDCEAVMSYFPDIFKVLMGEEGNFTANQADRGNWTGGAIGAGECKGTKFGISAAAYPALDIAGLTPDAAMAIYRTDYFDKIQGDALPPRIALLGFDAAVNNGVTRSIRFLQAGLGVAIDGLMTPGGETVRAAQAWMARDPAPVLTEMLARRLDLMANDPDWKAFGLGWARRLAGLPFKAQQFPVYV